MLLLELNDYDGEYVSSPAEATARLAKGDVELVIQDMNFERDNNSGDEGRQLFYQLRSMQADLPIILITAWSHLDMAVELVKTGAADYLSKPWDDNKLLTSMANLLQMAELQQKNNDLQQCLQQHEQVDDTLQKQYQLCGLVYQSPLMQRLVDMACKVAPTDVPVLITGPNGAGKEKIAEIIQANSRRYDQPFIKVNVGALSSQLLEVELFGAEKGAYTGADQRRIGRFEAADGGTLFLDEMANLPLGGQHKLLRILQTGEFERVGSSVTQRVDVRIITATNDNLSLAISEGRFREDLYYRLNVIELKVPALAQRPQDITLLAQLFLQQLATPATTQTPAEPEKTLSAAALAAMQAYPWPGNVRELYNRMQRACLLSQSPAIDSQDLDLPAVDSTAAPEAVLAATLSAETIAQALDQQGGVVARAARQLGISRQALYRRLSKQSNEQ